MSLFVFWWNLTFYNRYKKIFEINKKKRFSIQASAKLYVILQNKYAKEVLVGDWGLCLENFHSTSLERIHRITSSGWAKNVWTYPSSKVHYPLGVLMQSLKFSI